MRVALAECPEPYFGRGGEAPIRLSLAAAALRQAGHDVALEDGGVHGDFASWAAAVRDSRPELLFFHGDTKHLILARRLAAESASWEPVPFRILWGNHSDALDVRTLEEAPEFDAILRHDPEDTLCHVAASFGRAAHPRDLSGIPHDVAPTQQRGAPRGDRA